MTPEEKEKIKSAIDSRSAKLPCPRCGNQKFVLAEGYFSQSLQESLGGIILGGPAIPSVVVVCNKCGFMSQHALGALGLLPPKDEVEKDSKQS